MCQYLVHRQKVDNKTTMETGENTYNIDRKAASKLLKVSMRTVDRYVKAKKLSIKIINGRVWLSRKEIVDFKNAQKEPIYVDRVTLSTSGLSIDDDIDKVDKVEVIDQENFGKTSSRNNENALSNEIYKKLYFDTKEELNEKQERLEIANYRVGQLEAQIKNSIPMLEYHRENYERKKLEEDLEVKIIEHTSLLRRVNLDLKTETFKKRMALIIVFTILALQPLWLLLIYK